MPATTAPEQKGTDIQRTPAGSVDLPGATTARVVVCPGDFILADDAGAIAIREAIGSGLSLAYALKQFGHV